MRESGKKVLFVVPSLTGGGGQKVAATLCEALARAGEIELVLAVFDADSARELHPSVRVRHIDVRERGGPLYTAGKFFQALFELAGIIRRERPAVILAFMDYCNTLTLLASRLAGTRSRVVISVHTLFSAFMRGKGADARGRLLKVLADRLYGRADAVVAVSRGAASDLAGTFGLQEERIQVIGNPFDLENIRRLAREPLTEPLFEEGTPVFLSVGRLSAEKGGEDLLRAFSLLRRQVDSRLVFLGEGSERERLEGLSEELGLDRDVFFLGYRDNPFRYMARSTAFVLPSRYEGFGNVLVEAMACGLPVAATRCYDGIEEIVEDGKTGLLVEVGDVEGMAAALRRLLEDASLRRQLAENALKRAEVFDSGRIAERYRAVLGV